MSDRGIGDLRKLRDVNWIGKFWLGLLAGALLLSLSSHALALEDAEVEKAFVKFQHEWIEMLTKYGKYGKSHLQVQEDQAHKGSYIASYLVLTEPFEYRIKKTGQKASPYVGVIRYKKVTYSSKGNTPEQASAGKFKCEHESIVTEIFRFSGNKWVY